MTELPVPTPLDLLSARIAATDQRRKGQLHGAVTARLRSMIVTGVLAPGQRLNERELCDRLRVSRTPIREAIKSLTQEGLVVSLPNRSSVVASMDPAEVRGLVDVVATIEGLAGRLAAERVTDSEIAELGILHYQMMLHHSRDELPGYFETNKAFHRKIVEVAANPVLLWIWDLLAMRIDRARYSSNLWPKRWEAALREHQGLLDALAARDGERMERLMAQHLRNGLSLVLQTFDAAARPNDGQGSDQSA